MADETKEPVKEPVKPVVAPPAPKPAVATAPVAPPAQKPVAAPVAHTPEGVTLATSKGADGVAVRTISWRVGDEIEDAVAAAMVRALCVNKRLTEATEVDRVFFGK